MTKQELLAIPNGSMYAAIVGHIRGILKAKLTDSEKIAEIQKTLAALDLAQKEEEY